MYEYAENERYKRDKLIMSKQNSGSGIPILYMHSDAGWREKISFVVFFYINSGLNIMDLSKQSNQQCHLYFSLFSQVNSEAVTCFIRISVECFVSIPKRKKNIKELICSEINSQ